MDDIALGMAVIFALTGASVTATMLIDPIAATWWGFAAVGACVIGGATALVVRRRMLRLGVR